MAEEVEKQGTKAEEEEEKDDNSIEEQEGNSGENGSSVSDEKPQGSVGKTFTQEQVNRMMAREKSQGRNTVFKELGIDPKDTKAVAMVKALIESQKTEEQKAAEKESETQSKVLEAERRAQLAEAKAEAMMLGVKSQYVDDAVTLAIAKLSDDTDLKTIIGEFKTKYPVWFQPDEKGGKPDKGKTGQRGTGSSVKSASKDKKGEEKGLGARLAAQRKTNKKTSYWGNNNK